MSNEERDQIDLQARVILGQCADRVSKLEQLEKGELIVDRLYEMITVLILLPVSDYSKCALIMSSPKPTPSTNTFLP